MQGFQGVAGPSTPQEEIDGMATVGFWMGGISEPVLVPVPVPCKQFAHLSHMPVFLPKTRKLSFLFLKQMRTQRTRSREMGQVSRANERRSQVAWDLAVIRRMEPTRNDEREQAAQLNRQKRNGRNRRTRTWRWNTRRRRRGARQRACHSTGSDNSSVELSSVCHYCCCWVYCVQSVLLLCQSVAVWSWLMNFGDPSKQAITSIERSFCVLIPVEFVCIEPRSLTRMAAGN